MGASPRRTTSIASQDNCSPAPKAPAAPALANLIDYARDGDTIVVSSMDRLARTVVDLNQIVGELTAKGVVVEFLTENLNFRPGATDHFAEFQLNMMASFAQLERAITKERQADGIRAT